jgi:hypothetical protein
VVTNPAGAGSLKLQHSRPPGKYVLVLGARPQNPGVAYVDHYPFLGVLPAEAGEEVDITELYTVKFGVPPRGHGDLANRMRASSWAERGISQAVRVERLVGLSGGFTEECFQFWSRARISQQLLPSLVVLLGEQETGEVGNLGSLLRWQRLADANDFFRRSAHSQYLAEKGQAGQTVACSNARIAVAPWVILTRAKLMAHSQLFNEGSEHRIAGGVLYEV